VHVREHLQTERRFGTALNRLGLHFGGCRQGLCKVPGGRGRRAWLISRLKSRHPRHAGCRLSHCLRIIAGN